MEPPVHSFSCPLCHHIDAVTKVSTIVDAGSAPSSKYHATGHTSGTSVRTSTTALARKLAPPSLPLPPIALADSVGCGAMLLLGIGLFIAGVGYWLMVVPGGTGQTPGILFLLTGMGFIVYLLLTVLITIIIRQKKRPRWQQALEIWDHLYYCTRDDIVFLPDAPQHSAPSSQISALLYPSQV